MSITLIRTIFECLPDCQNWSVHLLRFHHTKRNGTQYNCRLIQLEPQERLYRLIQEISESYCEGSENHLKKYTDLRRYDGTCESTTIYKLTESESNIPIDLDTLLQGVAESDTEYDPLEMKANAYILSGQMVLENDEIPVKLISINSPIISLKHKFLLKNNRFIEITDKVLNLRTTMNVLIYDRDVYFLDMAGEKLFNMERAYKQICEQVVDRIEELDMVSDIVQFRQVATTGHNPRRFAAFSNEKLELLVNEEKREKVRDTFSIPLTSGKKFDTTDNVNAEKLVKVLCNKAMWDILEETPVEIDGSKKWEE